MRRSKVVQGGVRADEVVEEDEHGNEIVGGREGRKALFGFVPCLELLVEALNEVVGNVSWKLSTRICSTLCSVLTGIW